MAGFVLAASAAFAADDAAPRLVTLNVIATDAQGRAVTDLTAADLQITDQGKAMPIVAFRNEALHTPATAPGPGLFTNQPAPAVSRVQVVLFDVLNLDMSRRKPAMEQIVHALESLDKSDSVYLYLLNLSGDLAPVRALPDTPPDPRPAATPWTRGVRPMLEQAVGAVATSRPAKEHDTALRVKQSYAALESLGSRMAQLPGRKNVLWITFGVPCNLPMENGQIWDCRPNLNQVAGKLEQANVAVSPIAMQAAAADPESNLTLQQFVELTGGKLYGGGDIERAIPDAIEQSRATYRVQYAPPSGNWDGKVHKIRVTSPRRGISLQSRQSYTAAKSPAPVDEYARNMAYFQSPFEASDIALSVAATAGAQPHTLHLRIGMDPQDLLMTPRGDLSDVHLTFYVAAFLPGDRLQPYPPLPVDLHLTAEQREKMSRDGMRLGHDVLVVETIRKIRLLVFDRFGQFAGTVTIPIS
jgi:VWFA-related protein